MSTTTATFGHITPADEATSTVAKAAPRKSFFERLIEARMRQARARLRPVFAHMSDAQLTDIGFNADQIRDARTTGAVSTHYWS